MLIFEQISTCVRNLFPICLTCFKDISPFLASSKASCSKFDIPLDDFEMNETMYATQAYPSRTNWTSMFASQARNKPSLYVLIQISETLRCKNTFADFKLDRTASKYESKIISSSFRKSSKAISSFDTIKIFKNLKIILLQISIFFNFFVIKWFKRLSLWHWWQRKVEATDIFPQFVQVRACLCA